MIELTDKLSWFAGDTSALDFCERVVYIAHTWDDLVDKDRPVDVNEFVANLLLYLPSNLYYRKYETELRALFAASFAGYLAANIMEKSGDEHRVELAHYFRYLVVNVVSFMLVTFHGVTRGAEALSQIAPLLIPERVHAYMQEHLAEMRGSP